MGYTQGQDNITIGLEIQKNKDSKAMERVEELLKTYDLWDFRNMYPKELSGGMRQRVALIRTLSVITSPLVGFKSFVSIFRMVDFPEPDGPSSACRSRKRGRGNGGTDRCRRGNGVPDPGRHPGPGEHRRGAGKTGLKR